MTVSKPRALFVDNRQSTLQNWKEILELSGFAVHVYYVQTRDWVEECRRLAQRVRPHVAVLDLRLEEDYRPSDVSGMRLLEWMKSASPATGVVIYSAYLDAALDQQIAHLGAEFFNKGGASSKLLEMVHRLASKASAATRSNPIGWPNAWDQARIAERLLETVQADDVQTHNICEDLVHQLFPDAPHLVVQHLEGAVGVEPEPVSIGRSVVGYVQRDNLPVKKIVKIATSERVRQEKENYQSYIRDQVVGIYHTQLENSTLFWDLGASIYSLLAEEEQRLQSFLRFFQSTEDVAQIWQPIYWFFKNAWKYHYANAVSGEHSMYEEYSRCFKLDEKMARFDIQSLSLDQQYLAIGNPVSWIQQNKDRLGSACTRQAITHGDFHGDNMFTNGERLWVIDFERTGRGHVLRDFCELAVDVIVRGIDKDKLDLPKFIRVAAQIVGFHLEEDATLHDAEVLRLVEFNRLLQDLALEVTSLTDQREYQLALLFDAVFTFLRNGDPDRLIEKQRAWILAVLLCEKLTVVDAGSPTHADPHLLPPSIKAIL